MSICLFEGGDTIKPIIPGYVVTFCESVVSSTRLNHTLFIFAPLVLFHNGPSVNVPGLPPSMR